MEKPKKPLSKGANLAGNVFAATVCLCACALLIAVTVWTITNMF